MALITRVYQVDDIDGSEDDVSTVQFHLDGVDYEIDLSAANDERLRGKLAKFLDVAKPFKPARSRPARRTRTPAAAPVSSREQTQAVREWARSNGFEVSARGRIPQNVRDAFDAAH